MKIGFYESPLGYDNGDWIVDDVIKVEKKRNFCLKNSSKDIILSEEDEKHFRNKNICRFCEKNIEFDKIRDHRHLTDKNRGPAQNNCKINIRQKQDNFILFVFNNFSNDDCHLFLKNLIDEKNDKVKLDNVPKTNEEYISVTYGCIRLVDSHRLLSSSLDSLVETLVINSNKKLENLEKRN